MDVRSAKCQKRTSLHPKVYLANYISLLNKGQPAADAPVLVDDDDAVGTLVGRLDRADLRARWIVAVIAEQDYGLV